MTLPAFRIQGGVTMSNIQFLLHITGTILFNCIMQPLGKCLHAIPRVIWMSLAMAFWSYWHLYACHNPLLRRD